MVRNRGHRRAANALSLLSGTWNRNSSVIGRAIWTLIAAIAIVAQPAAGSSSRADVPVVDGTINADSWAALSTNPRLQHCTTLECTTLKAILGSFKVLDDRDFPNSMARPGAAAVPPATLPIVAHARASAESARNACQLLATIVGGVADLSVVLHGIELASLLVPVQADCVRQVAPRAPETLEDTPVMHQAHSLCLARGEPACESLSR
jgi:hypothetical protein